ncbi:MAG: hypothetical protein L6R39_005308 [Caloplaca ligustica]|nr:MAG: hypothetical protein L6R39_005308 [Caloplaca ligustica]
MVVKTIYVTRHALRAPYTVDAASGQYKTRFPSPTAIPNDVPLTAHGVAQSRELAAALTNLDPPIDYIYSSPLYRCLQTIEPAVALLQEHVKVRVDNGIGEWYGRATFDHPSPASLKLLSTQFFPLLRIDPEYVHSCTPPASGEYIQELHDRIAYALARIIGDVDKETGPEKDVAVLICTHAATLIAIGRCLTGRMPENVDEDDFLAPCAGLTKFVRRDPATRMHSNGDMDRCNYWIDGRGVGGGWDCVTNGNCDHLAGGAERTWHFWGEETFGDPKTISGPRPVVEGPVLRDGQTAARGNVKSKM